MNIGTTLTVCLRNGNIRSNKARRRTLYRYEKKEIVEKIILENIETNSNNVASDIKEVNLEKLKWSDSRIKLRDYIIALPTEDLVDLPALIDYGREHYHMNDKSINISEFNDIRKGYEAQINNVDDKKYIVIDLLKNKFLSNYLRYSLPLIEYKEFKF